MTTRVTFRPVSELVCVVFCGLSSVGLKVFQEVHVGTSWAVEM